MIMGSDPKKVASVIIAKKFSGDAMKKGTEDNLKEMTDGMREEEEPSDSEYAKVDAAKMVLSAIESKDAEKLAKAMSTLVSLCDEEEYGPEAEGEAE